MNYGAWLHEEDLNGQRIGTGTQKVHCFICGPCNDMLKQVSDCSLKWLSIVHVNVARCTSIMSKLRCLLMQDKHSECIIRCMPCTCQRPSWRSFGAHAPAPTGIGKLWSSSDSSSRPAGLHVLRLLPDAALIAGALLGDKVRPRDAVA